MPQRWLFKTEPSECSYGDLERDGRTVWDGVRNPLALSHLRRVRRGDEVLVYHSGRERAIVGLARVSRGAYPDPAAGDPRRVVVDLRPLRAMRSPLSLARIKEEGALEHWDLVRLPRLSVMPVSAEQWAVLRRMTEEER